MADSQLISIPLLLPQWSHESWKGSAYGLARGFCLLLIIEAVPIICPFSLSSNLCHALVLLSTPVSPGAWNRGAAWALWAQNECVPSAFGENKTFPGSHGDHQAGTYSVCVVLVFRVF